MTEIDQSFLELTREDPATGELVPIPAKERVERILEHPFAKDIIRSMDPQSLFNLVQEAGLNDSYELVVLSSPSQVQSFLDLDCWNRDVFDLDDFTEWIDILLQAEPKDFEQMIVEMDREALAIWIREQVAIFEWEADRDLLDTISDPVSSSPDGVYAFVFPDDERSGAQIRLLLERVYAYDLEFAMHLLEAVRWELTTDMMEHMYRKRSARLNDMGFVPFEDALEVYAWQDPMKWVEKARKKLDQPIEPTLSTVGQLPPVDYQLQSIEERLHSQQPKTFATALAAIGQIVPREEVAAQADKVLSQFRAVANRVHIADLGSTSDQNVARRAVERAQNNIGIALELLAPDSMEDRARALLTIPLKDIHRAGYSAVHNLGTQALKLTKRGNLTLLEDTPYSLLESEQEEMMSGLTQRRPVLHRGKGTEFQTFSDVQRTATKLGKIAFAELLFFAWLEADREALTKGEGIQNGTEIITFRTLFATLILRAYNGDGASLKPFTREEFAKCVGELQASQQLFDTIVKQAHEVVEELSPEDNELVGFARAFVEEQATWLAITLEQFDKDANEESMAALVLVAE
jgi:hypothetical protein